MTARIFADFSADVADGGDRVRIPKIADSFTVSNINTTSGKLTTDNVSETSTVLNVNKWKGSGVTFSDFQLAQAARSYNIRERYARNMGHTVARQFEVDMLSEFDNLDTSIGDSATALTSTNLELAHEILDSNSVPTEGRVLIAHPRAYWGDLYKRQKYYDASQFGLPTLPTGVVDQLYGTPVVKQELVRTTNGSLSNALIHRDALAFAVGTPIAKGNASSQQNGVRLSLIENPSDGLALKWVTDLMYGVVTDRSEGGVQILAQNNR